jgi:hypothetical protein
VILEHDWPARHWDFLLEAGESLRAWRLLEEPSVGRSVSAEPNFPHRPIYLEFEGPLSGDRGSVKRWDAGSFEWLADNSDRVVVNLAGKKLQGHLTLQPQRATLEAPMSLSIAFKEWAVICRALAEGRQSLILRKGGIAEAGGQFRPEHDRFFLYPTRFHEQHRVGIKPELLPLLDAVEAEKPSAETIRFSHFAAVERVLHVTDLETALALDAFHSWTSEEVTRRFNYRTPGLYALLIRVYRLAEPASVVERPEYAGCKTWVELDQTVSIEGTSPVLNDAAFAEQVKQVTAALQPPE